MKPLKIIILTVLMLGGVFWVFNHNVSAAGNGVTITNFDISPKQIAVGGSGKILITFKVSVSDPTLAKSFCNNSSTFMWGVLVQSGTELQVLRSGEEAWPSSAKTYSFDFEVPFSGSSNGVVNLTGAIQCDNSSWYLPASYKDVARSTSVPLTIGAGGGAAVCGNGQCESGETQTSCPADCKPGQGASYSFEITNPLKGGATDFTSLVKIIAQWIFNLAIPIAVAMIVYSGILFLTAQGEPAKVTKAKEVLKYAVIGLAIILIGSGFVTLIQSVLDLGGTGSPNPTGTILPTGTIPPTGAGAVGNKCTTSGSCFTGLVCNNTICQRTTGNLNGEPCAGTTSCRSGLTCDRNGEDVQVIDGQTLGTCITP